MEIRESVVSATGHGNTAQKPAAIPAHLSMPTRYRVVHLEVRNQAYRAIRSPRQALAFATYTHALARTDKERELSLAGVDVVVTGRKAYAAWLSEPELRDRDILNTLPESFRLRVPAEVMAASLKRVRERLAQTRAYLESGGSAKRPRAGGSDWIAGAPEADRPWAPLNVGITSYGWKRLRTAHGLDVRYVATGDLSDKKAKVVLYLHGLGSRAEEGAELGRALAKLGDFVVVAPDLPGNGYTAPIPVAPPLFDGGDVIEHPNDPQERYLFLSSLDEFLDDFVDALGKEHAGIADRLVCLAGGSLGGNLALRATLRKPKFPVRSIASWSAGSVWDPFTKDAFQRLAASETLRDATMDEHLDARAEHWVSSTARDAYLRRTFEQQIEIVIGGKKIKARGPEMWWRKSIPDFAAREANSLADRLEVYDETFRRWQSRLAYEQLIFSHRAAGRLDALCGLDGKIPALLLAGQKDNFFFANIHDRTRDLANKLHARGVKGSCHLLADTGHSIHDERPQFLARAMADFLKAHVKGVA